MRFCQFHWVRLRKTIIEKGGGDFIAPSGEEAAKQMAAELSGEAKTRNNYDPLMAAHNMILGNAVDLIKASGGNPFSLFVSNPEHPEWECPICYLNYLSAEHDRLCQNPNCTKQKGKVFDDWIEQAANGAMAAIPKES